MINARTKDLRIGLGLGICICKLYYDFLSQRTCSVSILPEDGVKVQFPKLFRYFKVKLSMAPDPHSGVCVPPRTWSRVLLFPLGPGAATNAAGTQPYRLGCPN